MKNKQAFYLLLTANGVSGFAQGISMIAIPWYFADILKQSSAFGFIYAITTAITLFWGLYAGTLIDKYPRKKIFLVLCISGLLVLGSASFCGFMLGHVPALLAGFVFTYTILNYNIHFPALYAFGQEISERSQYGKINSLLEVSHQAVSILSGGIAALLLGGAAGTLPANFLFFEVQPWKLHEIFLLDAFTYLLAFLLVAMIRHTPETHLQASHDTAWQRLREGIVFLRQRPALFLFGNASYAIFVVLLIMVHQLQPMYVSNHLQAGGAVYAYSEMIYALGALLAGMGITRLFSEKITVQAILGMMCCSVLVLLLCSFTKSVGVLLFTGLVMGLTNAGTRVLRITYLFNHIPNHIIGRAGSVFQSLNVLFRLVLISVFTWPFFTQGSGVTWAYFICAVFVGAWAFLLFRQERKSDTLV